MLYYLSQSYTAKSSNNTADSILRIIGIEEGSMTIYKELKTIKPYIIGLAAMGYLRVCNTINIKNII